MISETYFCSHYSSVWRSLTPSMEDCVRRYNLSEYDREWPPLPSLSDPRRRGLINEAAFIFFCENNGRSRDQIAAQFADFIEDAFKKAATFLQLQPHAAQALEKREAMALAGRMDTFFSASKSGGGPLLVSPEFYGCGILGSCRGDVIKGDTLFEIKAGDRTFRSIDFRQILTYASLRYAHDKYIFPKIGIFNPRTGVSIVVKTSDFSHDVSGLDPHELFERVLSALSANLVSD